MKVKFKELTVYCFKFKTCITVGDKIFYCLQPQLFFGCNKNVSKVNNAAALAAENDRWIILKLSSFSDSETPNFDTSDGIIYQILITKFHLIWLFISINDIDRGRK